MKGLKTLTAVLLSAVLFLSGFPIYAMGSGLDLPIIEDGGTTYYNVTSKADLKTAVLYCRDNFTSVFMKINGIGMMLTAAMW